MRIERVEAIYLDDIPIEAPPYRDAPNRARTIIVEVENDKGLVGYGIASAPAWPVVPFINTRLADFIIGRDPSSENIAVARQHCAGQELEINYQACTVQDLAKFGEKFDVAICLEVLEHVPDIESLLMESNSLLNKNGIMNNRCRCVVGSCG